jgi:hypothetical protein
MFKPVSFTNEQLQRLRDAAQKKGSMLTDSERDAALGVVRRTAPYSIPIADLLAVPHNVAVMEHAMNDGRGPGQGSLYRTYAALPAETAPPIKIRRDSDVPLCVDGGHRLAAAKLRGDTEVKVIEV